MPSIVDKIGIESPFLKKTAKLLPCQKEMIVYWCNRGMSQRKLAKMFNVSRRLIQFITDPDKHKANVDRRNEKGGSKIYYNREKHTKSTKVHRQYKKELFV